MAPRPGCTPGRRRAYFRVPFSSCRGEHSCPCASTTPPPTSRPRPRRARSDFHEWIGDKLGDPVLAPEGLHAGVHDRARLHGQDRARVHQAQRQADRPLGRPGRQPQQVGQGHRGDAGREGQLPDDRRHRPQGRQALQHAAGRGGRHLRRPHRRHQRDRALGLHHRPRQEDQADADLPDDDRPQLRRDPARARLDAAHREAQGRDAGELEAGRGRDHRRLGDATRTRRSCSPKASRPSSRTCARCASRAEWRRARRVAARLRARCRGVGSRRDQRRGQQHVAEVLRRRRQRPVGVEQQRHFAPDHRPADPLHDEPERLGELGHRGR